MKTKYETIYNSNVKGVELYKITETEKQFLGTIETGKFLPFYKNYLTSDDLLEISNILDNIEYHGISAYKPLKQFKHN